jgi:PleD family two-component response regulator
MGVTIYEPAIQTLDELLKQADYALYAAKHRGGINMCATPN